ncbi:MAG TPA: thioredoxin TrxC [Nitrosospira sp.]|jgi:thioredoxin 2|nr:thioredoxin TrxC [Nitrosospira sp.]
MSDSLHLVCPHCHSINRVPTARIGEQPNCGQCHQPIFAGQPLDLTGATFTRYINRNDVPILVDFWAPWCGPCKMMAPAFKEAAALLEPHIRLAKVNTDVEQTLGAQYLIRSIPTLILFKGGRELARQAGAMMTQDIVRWTRSQALG